MGDLLSDTKITQEVSEVIPLTYRLVLCPKVDTSCSWFEMLVAWMMPAEIGARDLSPNATVQPVSGAVGIAARAADDRPCDKPTLPPHVEALERGCRRRLLNSSAHWWLQRAAIQVWVYVLWIERKIQLIMWKTLTIKCQPTGKTKTLETELTNMGSIAFPSITFTCCQHGVLKIDICSPGIPEEVEGRVQLRNHYK